MNLPNHRLIQHQNLRRLHHHAFTLVEFLVVIAIIASLASLLSPVPLNGSVATGGLGG